MSAADWGPALKQPLRCGPADAVGMGAALSVATAVRSAKGVIRGWEIHGNFNDDTVDLAKRVVQACQHDGVYPEFQDKEWGAQMRLKDNGDIVIRPLKKIKTDLDEGTASTDSPSPFWPDEQLGQPLPSPRSPPASPTPARPAVSHGCEAEEAAGSSGATPDAKSPPVRHVPGVSTPEDCKDMSPDSKYLMKMALKPL